MTTLDARVSAPAAAPVRHVLSATALGELGLTRLLDRADAYRAARAARRLPPALAGRQVALLFEKPSLRTRVSFEVGITSLGGHAVALGPDEVGLGRRESPEDVGRNLARWVDAIVLRTFAHETLERLAGAAGIPVVNALTDHEHPCQALADLLSLRWRFGRLPGLEVAWVGDGNNVAHSLLLAAALAGVSVHVATPPGYEPDPAVVAEARRLGRPTGASVRLTHDPTQAVAGARAVVTDVWTSMGQEAQAELRRATFAGFQVNAALLAGTPVEAVLHCMPAHRGEEITGELLDGPLSLALEQAENRLYVQQAILTELLAADD